jgi:hypothetical protein
MFRKKFIDTLRDRYQQGGMYDQPHNSFEGGGWKDMAKWGLKAVKPFLSGAVSKAAGPISLLLGSQKAYAPPVTNTETGINRFTGNQEYTPFGKNPSWGGGGGNVNVSNVNRDLSSAMAPKINQTGGMYEQMQQFESGGVALPGGQMQSIPGSDAVEFNGATHDQGGIMMDSNTEVEDGETMDKVSMKNGGQKDYFFSNYLKKGNKTYADMHKELLATGASQKEIDWLAKMQEKSAGRSSKKIQTAKLGGVVKHQLGNFAIDDSGALIDNDINQNNLYDPRESLVPYHNKVSDAVRDGGGAEVYERMTKKGFVWNGTSWVKPNKENNTEKKTVVKTVPKKEKKRKQETLITIPPIAIKPIPNKMYDRGPTTTIDADGDGIPDFIDADYQPITNETTDKFIGPINQVIEKKKQEILNDNSTTDQEKRTLLQQLKDKVANQSDVPLEAWIGAGAQLIPAAYSLLHKQPDALKSSYTPGFTSPIKAERGKYTKLDRVNFNDLLARNAGDARGLNKAIETSGGGPANIINKMKVYSDKQSKDMEIKSAETKANVDISNREAQMKQQMNINNMTRNLSASTLNAQLSRAETARFDTINSANTAAQQKVTDDQEYQKYAGIGAFGTNIAGITGDILSYKGQERLARATGSEGIYDRDKLRTLVTKYSKTNDLTDDKGYIICTAGNCTEKQINAFITSTNTKKNNEDE